MERLSEIAGAFVRGAKTGYRDRTCSQRTGIVVDRSLLPNRARSRYGRSSLRVPVDRRYYYRLPERPVKFMMSRLMALDSRENDPLRSDAMLRPLLIDFNDQVHVGTLIFSSLTPAG